MQFRGFGFRDYWGESFSFDRAIISVVDCGGKLGTVPSGAFIYASRLKRFIAPGATWVPDAMLTVAQLREDEGKYTEAVKVYENLRNLYPESEEAKTAVLREAGVRTILLKDHAYNRARTQDTIDFMKMALQSCRPEDVAAIRAHLDAALGLMEDEAYRGACFYDSTTRTKRSAVNAYEQFLRDYPQSAHADEIRARIEELKGMEK